MLTRLVLLGVLFSVPLMSLDEPKMRRLESLSWSPVSNKLTWVVSNGTKNEKGEYQPEKDSKTYVIDLQDATMEYQGIKRRFSTDEAENVAVVMGLISKYAQESTVWWEAGKGDPVNPQQKVRLMPAPQAPWPVQAQVAATTPR